MFERITAGFELARSSWRVLRTDKHLLVFPILSGISLLLVMASFIAPFALRPQWAGIEVNGPNVNMEPPAWFWVVLFAFYFCNYFVIVFFNAALISCALVRFNGGEPTLSDGIGAASARLPQIFAWALVSATVGVILKAIESAHEKAGEIMSAVLGTAWTVTTYFVVPVLVVERVGPFQAISRSLGILRKAWGEALVGHAGIGLFTFLLALPWMALLALGFYVALGLGMVVGWALVGLGAVYFLVWMAISSALHGIHVGALYQYAAHGQVPPGFDTQTMTTAFGPK